MNIREVIEKLHEGAAQLPDGLNSEVQVHICNGNDPGLMTPSIEVDTMWTHNEQTLALSGGFAIVQGHPHRGEDDSTTRPVTAEIDARVEKWAADQHGVEGRPGRSDLIRLSSAEGEYEPPRRPMARPSITSTRQKPNSRAFHLAGHIGLRRGSSAGCVRKTSTSTTVCWLRDARSRTQARGSWSVRPRPVAARTDGWTSIEASLRCCGPDGLTRKPSTPRQAWWAPATCSPAAQPHCRNFGP